MCDCIEKINADLKPEGQCLDATMFGVQKATTMLIRTDKWKHENRRGKPTRLVATFCPVCGEKYADLKDEAPQPPKIEIRRLPNGEYTSDGAFWPMVDGENVGEDDRTHWHTEAEARAAAERFVAAKTESVS